MKKKVIFAVVAFLITGVTILNLAAISGTKISDISLKILNTAFAQNGEDFLGCYPDKTCTGMVLVCIPCWDSPWRDECNCEYTMTPSDTCWLGSQKSC